MGKLCATGLKTIRQCGDLTHTTPPDRVLNGDLRLFDDRHYRCHSHHCFKIARWRLFDIMIIVMVVAGVVKIVVKKIVIAWWAETI